MTENRMTLTRVVLDGRTIIIDPEASSPGGGFRHYGHAIDPGAEAGVRRLLTVAALVNDAAIELTTNGARLHGDRTETALLVAAHRAGLDPTALACRHPRRRRWRRPPRGQKTENRR